MSGGPQGPVSSTQGPDVITLVAVALGGAIGALGRYAVGLAFPHTTGAFPVSTFLVNITGSLAIGVLVGWLSVQHAPSPLARPFVGVGVLGGWTTFSALAVDAVSLARSGHDALALGYVTATFVVGVLLTGAGIAAAQRIWAPA